MTYLNKAGDMESTVCTNCNCPDLKTTNNAEFPLEVACVKCGEIHLWTPRPVLEEIRRLRKP